MEQEQLWGRRSWRAELMQCGSKKPLRDKNHGLFTITALKEQRGSERLQPAPGVASITLQGCFQDCLDFFLLFFKCRKEWAWVFFPQKSVLFSKDFFFLLQQWNTLNYLEWNVFQLANIITWHITPDIIPVLCVIIYMGLALPFPPLGCFSQDVLWLRRTYSLCQDRSSTTGKAAWLRILFTELETPSFLLPCSRTTIGPRQKTSDEYFGLKSN